MKRRWLDGVAQRSGSEFVQRAVFDCVIESGTSVPELKPEKN